MKLFKGSVGALRMCIRQYEISSDRDTAEIRRRLLGRIQARLRHATSCFSERRDELVAQTSESAARRFPNRQGVDTFGASAGLETHDTADSEVCATICV
jgi:hypothetical protein